MKAILIGALSVLCVVSVNCTSNNITKTSTCFKGRLEVKGICSNYTIKLLSGAVDTSKIVAAWTDEASGKNYTNVFALGSACNFPDSLQQGDEFYFVLDTSTQQCPVCMAYYPKPSKALSIKVIDKACN